MNIVPENKIDYESCNNLSVASDEAVREKLPELLEWVQDLNWPVAPLVIDRIKGLGDALIAPITTVLRGKDSIWKYWIITELIPKAGEMVKMRLISELQQIIECPSETDRLEEVDLEAQKILKQHA